MEGASNVQGPRMDINHMLHEQLRRPSQATTLPTQAPPQSQYHNPSRLAHSQPNHPQTQHPHPEASQITKTSRSRKKDQPLLQRSTPSPRIREHTFSYYTPPEHTFVAAPAPQGPPPQLAPPPRSYPTAPPQPERRMSGVPRPMTNGDYRPPLVHPPTSLTQSPPVQYSGRPPMEKMDFLADLASRQPQPQPVTRIARNSISRDNIRSPTRATPPVANLRNGSISMMGSTPNGGGNTPTELPIGSDIPTVQPRSFTASSLSQEDLHKIQQLSSQLVENSQNYNVHISLIRLLHQGFVAHIFPPDSPSDFQEPHQYPLLADLRQARTAMDSRFPVGEELWRQWIEDECILARTVEDRVAVMELCQKAVQEELGSTKLWRLYGDWMWLLYKTTHDIFSGGYQLNTLENHPVVSGVLEHRRWTEDEKVVGKDIFSWNPMLDVWIHGFKAVEWHMDDSNVVWDPYVQILNHDLARNPSPDKVKHVWTLFADRLQKPHATWQETFQGFSQFVSQNYDESIYEETMVAANKQAAQSKHDYELRSEFEVRLERAAEMQDQVAEWTVLSEYLEWESSQFKRKDRSAYAYELYVTLLERANLQFPTSPEWWEDHIDLILDHPNSNSDLLALVHRASRHCPWSGDLWSKHLLALEASHRPYKELDDTKHRATSTGLLEDLGGMEELIKVYTAWCGYLRRRAFSSKATDEESDVAEVGITSCIENVKAIGGKKFGKDFKGDPEFRAERMYIKFLSQSDRMEEARETWKSLTASHGGMAEFWQKYYLWEMTVWAKNGSTPPVNATNLLSQAVRRAELDDPKRIVDLYLHHCAQHETIDKVQQAGIEARQAKIQAAKREEEARAAATAQQAEQNAAPQEVSAMGMPVDDSLPRGKRKREDQGSDHAWAKRAKSTEEVEQHQQTTASSMEPSEPKRDRENTTIIVKDLPYDTTELKVRKFFRDCGDIINLQLARDDKEHATTATIEFSTKDDVLAAQTKAMKPFEGQNISIQSGEQTTLYVCNYPPEADESLIRGLFEQYGEIVEVRFPSLRFNTHRRFCYVQFRNADHARAATASDGVSIQDGHVLEVKISDPSKRKNRVGAMEEGREVHLGNLPYKVTDTDIKSIFDTPSAVQNVRIPRNMDGKSKGIAFVVFTTKDEAESAVKTSKKELKGRALRVEMSVPNATGAKRAATTIIKHSSASPDPQGPNEDTIMGGDDSASRTTSQDPEVSSVPSGATQTYVKNHHQRTLLLRRVPDTVNDAQIRKLMSKFGELRKITLKMDKGEAMVEFNDVKDVGKAEMAMQDYEITKGVRLEVARIEEKKGGRRGSDAPSGGPARAIKGKGSSMNPAQVKRPGQHAGARRGGKGGLGFKKGSSAAAPSENAQPNGLDESEKDTAAAGKTQNDFRAMLTKN